VEPRSSFIVRKGVPASPFLNSKNKLFFFFPPFPRLPKFLVFLSLFLFSFLVHKGLDTPLPPVGNYVFFFLFLHLILYFLHIPFSSPLSKEGKEAPLVRHGSFELLFPFSTSKRTNAPFSGGGGSPPPLTLELGDKSSLFFFPPKVRLASLPPSLYCTHGTLSAWTL